MGTLLARLHEEGRAKGAGGGPFRGSARPGCLLRRGCKRKWGGCEAACGGFTPDLRRL